MRCLKLFHSWKTGFSVSLVISQEVADMPGECLPKWTFSLVPPWGTADIPCQCLLEWTFSPVTPQGIADGPGSIASQMDIFPGDPTRNSRSAWSHCLPDGHFPQWPLVPLPPRWSFSPVTPQWVAYMTWSMHPDGHFPGNTTSSSRYDLVNPPHGHFLW